MELGFFDGEFISLNERRVELEDRGYQFGDGIYEATHIYNGISRDAAARSVSCASLSPTWMRN